MPEQGTAVVTEELCPVVWSEDHRRHACVQHKGNVHLCVCHRYKVVVPEASDAEE